ncbi:nucleotidyltransferase domain-containing protein [Sporolactobacillus laevolacticus]|uniref:Polymerase nucleotidyl transferase domain-containing protein n=1 Tax=Sporolactobacillus laevolacticus DSM 442 TaxID=1395513 RepID=V6IW76_9BACL|nr:nucleotidyltransferase domain-containing protein [Sporolactobacillus laevolacticus]EST10781.1 hypothetical protein P343_15400 [Sporolactobacillus laevolacticus DSM 442]
MNSRSNELIRLAKEFVTLTFPEESYASISGSAARGTADKYSDIDLTIFNASDQQIDKNIEFCSEIVQVHFTPLPQIEQVYKSPWAFRFLSEIKIIRDKSNLLETIQNRAIEFFNSLSGKQQMISEVQRIVKDRTMAANQFYKAGRTYSATHAAMGAWCEAAFLHMYMTERTLATGCLIPCIRKNQQLFSSLKKYSSIRECSSITDFSPILHLLREYLREQNYDLPFDLDPLQEMLVERKNKRFINTGDLFNLQWQMYGEALWLYFCIDDQKTFEQFYESLPIELKRGLSSIGFVPLEKQNIDGLCNLSQLLIKDYI